MPVLPKSFYVLGAGVKTARIARQLKRTQSAIPAQHAAFRALAEKLSKTEVGKDSGIEASGRYEQFKSRTPVRSYAQFAPYIERMKRGEADILWPGQCLFYAVSSATAGTAKHLPVTEEMLNHFRRAGGAALLQFSARVGHSGVFRGRHLWLGASTAVSPLCEVGPFQAFCGDISGIAALNLPKWVEQHLYEPRGNIGAIDDWTKRLEAIVARTRALDITLVAGMPSWLLLLCDALLKGGRGGSGAQTLQDLWPNLECLVHGGVPITPFEDDLRRAAGPAVKFHEVYAASESFIAAQDTESGGGLRLMADAGVFYEFVPRQDFDESLPANLGAKAVPLEGVRIGQDYVVLLTTPAGLSRYVLGDVVRFTSTEPPRLVYVGRTGLELNAFGERVIEKEITESLVAVCKRHDWNITNFHVAPLFTKTLTGQTRGRHEWWVELRAGTVETPTGPTLAAKLDAELTTRNKDYANRRKAAGIEAPVVRLVMPGFFEHWMRHHGKWGGHSKMARCRNDRLIADEFAEIACFTED